MGRRPLQSYEPESPPVNDLVFITGASGFIGGQIVGAACSRTAGVSGCWPAGLCPNSKNLAPTWCWGISKDPAHSLPRLRGRRHRLSRRRSGRGVGPPDDFFRINVDGTRNVIAACQRRASNASSTPARPASSTMAAICAGVDESLRSARLRPAPTRPAKPPPNGSSAKPTPTTSPPSRCVRISSGASATRTSSPRLARAGAGPLENRRLRAEQGGHDPHHQRRRRPPPRRTRAAPM